jgi:hypothetical protein
MNKLDRYDFAMALFIDAIALGVLLLYPHFWILLAIGPIAVTMAVIRHFDIDELFPDEGNRRPHRVIVLVRVMDGLQDFGAHLIPGWNKQRSSDPHR